ncbi:MAG TPA: NAD(P)/FAD-dependent oxidoreductase [Chloroflexota bacterium]|nr:NAD(P)/FAD-dependent oxidoreductase [Chloroflexota bacterium]
MADRKRVVILGAGFGGAHVAKELAKLGGREGPYDITLVAEHNYLVYTPMLTEVVGGQLDPRHIAAPTRKLSPRITFVQGRVTEVDLGAKRVTLSVGECDLDIPQAARTVEADELVVALGSTTNYHGIPGLEEHSLTLKDVSDAGQIRNRALALLERAAVEPDSATREALLTFVVGGGGFSGVETMAALNDLVRDATDYYPGIERSAIRMVLAHHGDRLLPELGGGLAEYTRRHLERRQVEVRLHTSITGAGPDYVELNGSERIPTRLVVWTGGVKPSPVVASFDCRHGRHGGIVVDGCCGVVGREGVWALGDCAEVPTPRGGSYAPTGQNAVREGKLVARNIAAKLRGQQPRPFTYKPMGELALIGKRTGVADVFGFRFSGVAAWAFWRAAYLGEMPGLAKRAQVLMDWLLDLSFGIEIVDLPLHAGAHPARVDGEGAAASGGDPVRSAVSAPSPGTSETGADG